MALTQIPSLGPFLLKGVGKFRTITRDGPEVAPRRQGGLSPNMQQVDGLHRSGWSKRRRGFEVSIVGVKRRDDRDSHDQPAMLTIRLPIGSDADIVMARQQGRALAIAMKFSATDSAFIATTISELARALLSRTVRGEIWLDTVHDDERSGVVIVARDPVASDGVTGHRTNAAHFTLPDVCRLVDEFDIASDAGQGTTIRATKWRRRR
jgi:serine/threonine-protein kinase RsbT